MIKEACYWTYLDTPTFITILSYHNCNFTKINFCSSVDSDIQYAISVHAISEQKKEQ